MTKQDYGGGENILKLLTVMLRHAAKLPVSVVNKTLTQLQTRFDKKHNLAELKQIIQNLKFKNLTAVSCIDFNLVFSHCSSVYSFK